MSRPDVPSEITEQYAQQLLDELMVSTRMDTYNEFYGHEPTSKTGELEEKILYIMTHYEADH